MRAIMYHYVRRYDAVLPNFRYLDIDNFRKQLDYFDAEFGYVSFDEWCGFFNNGTVPEKTGKVVLTFDDAITKKNYLQKLRLLLFFGLGC